MTLEKPNPVATRRSLAAERTQVIVGGVRTAPRERSHRLDGLARIELAGCPVHITDEAGALEIITQAAVRPHPAPLAVSSINLDHVHHFGSGRRRLGAGSVEWLHLVDGAPIAHQAERLMHASVPRLAGSDLISGILDDADRRGLSVAVLGGSEDVTTPLKARMARDWPNARFVGHWTPPRGVLDDAEASRAIATEIRVAGADILIVCLGKPRQEAWIDAYGSATGAGALLAFGAVVDFLAGRVSRAPRWMAKAGLEWMWRLMLEPRRLARRYLIEGPPAYLAVRRSHFPNRV
jgi:exopolysaccharide biosynthesis WecB/TagA/CpsF family protein